MSQVPASGKTNVTVIESEDMLVTVEDRSTFLQIDSPLDRTQSTVRVEELAEMRVVLVGSTGGMPNEESVKITLSTAVLEYETRPGVISYPLPDGSLNLNQAKKIYGFVDGRYMPLGFGWQPSTDGNFIEIALPTDPAVRLRYLSAGVEYFITWVVA